MERRKLKERLRLNPTFRYCLKPIASSYNLTEDFFHELKEKDHRIYVIGGETDSGKSSAGCELAQFKQPTFTAAQVEYEPELVLKLVEFSKPVDVFIKDELLALSGTGSGRVEKDLKIMEGTLRERKNSLIFISSANENVPSAHYQLETIQWSTDKAYLKIGVRYPRTDDFMGFILVPIHWNNPVWVEYHKKKMEFMDRVVHRRLKSGTDIQEKAETLLKELNLEVDRKSAERKLRIREKWPNLSIGEERSVAVRLEQLIRLRNLQPIHHPCKPSQG